MALTLTPDITGQRADNVMTYGYLYDVLPVTIQTSHFPTGKLHIDITTINPATGTDIATIVDYAVLDFTAAGQCKFDVMELIQQHVQSNWFKIGKYTDIVWQTIVTPVFYRLYIHDTDLTGSATVIKAPIIGGRAFNEFAAAVTNLNPTNDFTKLGLTNPTYVGFPNIGVTLKDPFSALPWTPDITFTIPTTGCTADGGVLIWKSRFGGWCSFGFKIFSQANANTYLNELGLETFKAINGHPYIATNYTALQTTTSISMKAIAVPKEYGEAIKGLSSSPVIYLMRTAGAPLELVRLTSISGFGNNLANGYNIEVGLQLIDNIKQFVR